MADFSKFDELFNTEELAKEIQDLPDFEEVPDGKYMVKVESMELKESSNGNPMVAIQFNIEDGEKKGQKIFYNQVITKAFQLKLMNKFLESLLTDEEFIEEHIKFDSFSQYGELLANVLNLINMEKFAYELQVKTNNKGFKNFTVFEIF